MHEYDYQEEISGSLQVAIKSIPGLTIEGGATLDMNGVDKEFSESLEVTVKTSMTGYKIMNLFPSCLVTSSWKSLPQPTMTV